MNRHQKRAARVKARGREVDRVTAVHEAGHAVARVLVANSLGWSAHEAIEHIDIDPAPVAMEVGAQKRWLQIMGAVSGHFLSRPMEEFLQARMSAEALDARRDGTEMLALFTEMRAAGIDVDVWFHARSIEIVFGPWPRPS